MIQSRISTRPAVKVITLILALSALLLAHPALARDKFLDIQEVKSPSGITAWLVEDHSIPVLSMDFAFRDAGSSRDPKDKQGLARMLSNTMDEGAGDLTSEMFQKELRDLSISLAFTTDRDSFGGGLKTLTTNRARAFELLQLALTSPRFDAEAVDRMRAANQARIKASLSDPEWMAARILNDVAYQGHPYALNSGGTLSSLGAIMPDDLRRYAKSELTKDRLHIAVAGDITAEELAGALDTIFSALPDKAPQGESGVEDLTLKNEGQTVLFKQDIPQTIIEIMQPGISRKSPDYQTAQIMNFVLGSSGFGSRLMEEVREKRGLTYGIYSYLSNMDHFSGLAVSTSTANKNTKELLGLVKEEFEKIRSYPISEDELKNAKSYLIGSLPLSLTSTDKISALMLSIQMDDLGIDYLDKRAEQIEKTTVDDVFKISQKLLKPENFVTILVGNPENVTPTRVIDTLPNVQ